jgi:LuxR family maltose regulon positive regulatory protein
MLLGSIHMSAPLRLVSNSQPHVEAGEQALHRADWRAAEDAFRAALAVGEMPEAHEGLAAALYWQGDVRGAVDTQEAAYQMYQDRGNRRAAARVATWLALEYHMGRGLSAIANGWLQRAQRLLDGLEPSREHAWLLFWDAHIQLHPMYTGDPTTARARLAEASRLARENGLRDIEMMTLGLEGVMLVHEGNVAEGMRRLDEVSTAAVSGELTDRCAMGNACCYVLTTCEAVGDFERAAQWLARVKDHHRPQRLVPYDMYCRDHAIGILLWRGRWAEAEEEIGKMKREAEAMAPSLVPEAVSRLGELRRRQGRAEEAEALFAQVDTHRRAILGRAWMALDEGDSARATEMVDRYFRQLPPGDQLARLPALELLVEAHAGGGDVSAAVQALVELSQLAQRLRTPAPAAMVHLAEGRVACLKAEHDTGRRCLEDAVAAFERLGAPYHAARARQALSRCLTALGRATDADHEMKKAVAALRSLGVSEVTAGAAGLTRREQEVVRLVARGLSNKEIAATLGLSEHTIHRHVGNILTKLDLPSRSAAVAHAAKLGLLKA